MPRYKLEKGILVVKAGTVIELSDDQAKRYGARLKKLRSQASSQRTTRKKSGQSNDESEGSEAFHFIKAGTVTDGKDNGTSHTS